MRPQGNRCLVLLLLALPLCGAPAGAGTKTIEADLDAIQAQLLVLQKEHAMLREQLASQAAQLQHAIEERVRTERTGHADLVALVEELRREMEVLGQKAEDTNYRLSTLSGEIQATRVLLERTPATPAGTDASTGGLTQAEEGTAPGDAEPSGPGTAPLAGGAAPEEIFNTAYADYTRGNYPLAILGFREYVDRFPGSAFADDAMYWVGESYYSQGKFADAIQAFGEVAKRYPQGDKLPAAHLKRGYAYLESNQTAQGVVQLNALVEGFPQSEEARLARDRLRALGLKD